MTISRVLHSMEKNPLIIFNLHSFYVYHVIAVAFHKTTIKNHTKKRRENAIATTKFNAQGLKATMKMIAVHTLLTNAYSYCNRMDYAMHTVQRV